MNVNDRLKRVETELREVRKELSLMKSCGGQVPEYADLKTLARLFGNYSVASLRYRVRTGTIPKEIVRKEAKKILVNVSAYRELFV